MKKLVVQNIVDERGVFVCQMFGVWDTSTFEMVFPLDHRRWKAEDFIRQLEMFDSKDVGPKRRIA